MSSDEYQVQNIYQYSRKSYKTIPNGCSENIPTSNLREDINSDVADFSHENEVRSDEIRVETATCSCDADPEHEIANILHKKCPVIALAQQQLNRLLDETDRLLCESTRTCRSPYDFIYLCKNTLWSINKHEYALIILILIAYLFGLIIGAASCGVHHGKFDSAILTCIDNLFAPDTFPLEKSYHCIA